MAKILQFLQPQFGASVLPNNPTVGSHPALRNAFPEGVTPPDLLFDFATWHRDQPVGSVGWIEFIARDAEEFMPPGATCRDDFALFMNMPDGSAAGLWLTNDPDPHSAPFVLLGSEGTLTKMAPNLACFLDRLAKKQFDPDTFEFDFLPEQDVEDRTAALADWLATHTTAVSMIATHGRADYFGFDDGTGQAWLEDYIQNLEATTQADPDIRTLSDTLIAHGHRPQPNEYGFACTSFRVFAAGQTMVIKEGAALIVTQGVNSFSEVGEDLQELLLPPLFKLREKHAAARKGNGLWPSATLTILNSGLVEIAPNYHHEFAIGLDAFTPSDFAADQRAYPRPVDKIEPWQKALIDQGERTIPV